MRSLNTRSSIFRVVLNHYIYICVCAYIYVIVHVHIVLLSGTSGDCFKMKTAFHRIKCHLASLSDMFSLLSSVVLFLFSKWHSGSYFKLQCIFSSCYQQSRNDFCKREYFLIFRNSLA